MNVFTKRTQKRKQKRLKRKSLETERLKAQHGLQDSTDIIIVEHEELPPARRTVLCVCGAVRGVGGIDSWGSDVEEAYRINAENVISYSFAIC